jgi:hypothetical protein
MPLEAGKGQAAFKHNVATEVQAGKPAKQAVAIAYSEKERTGDTMAEGYSPIKGSITSLAEMNQANQRYNNQLEGETTFENTGDAAEPEFIYTVILKNGKRDDIKAPSARVANSIAENKYGYANISVAPQERLKKAAE